MCRLLESMYSKVFYCQQIVYKDPGNLSRFTLYVIASSAEKRKEWIDTLRTGDTD